MAISPAASEREAVRGAGPARGGVGRTMSARLLVVEDEEALSALLEYNLGKEGFAVRVSHDGEDALMAIEEEKPDLVLLDWMLPGLSGIEICRRIRAKGETRDP